MTSKCTINLPRRWSQLSYAGETLVPPSIESQAYSWPLFLLKRDELGNFTDDKGGKLSLEIRHPDTIDFAGEQLAAVKSTLANLTPEQLCIAEYWNAGPPTKQFTPIVDRLIDTYALSPPRAARVLAAVNGAFNDVAAVTWYLKYHYDVARPNQMDQTLATVVCTPYHPSYPAGHGVMAGTMETVLSYFFPGETQELQRLALDCAVSRVYAGVHYPADVQEGLRLGHYLGGVIVSILTKQTDSQGECVDIPHTTNLHAELMPPPYEQVIAFPRQRSCQSLLLPFQCPQAR